MSDNCPIAVLLVSDMPETLFSAYATPSTRPLITAQPEPPRILLPYRQIFNKLWVRHTSRHSPRILANPRSRNRRKPRASLIWPKTGSTITFRREYTARPSAVFSFACIFSLAVAGGEAGSAAAGVVALWCRCRSVAMCGSKPSRSMPPPRAH